MLKLYFQQIGDAINREWKIQWVLEMNKIQRFSLYFQIKLEDEIAVVVDKKHIKPSIKWTRRCQTK